ncbi:general odorant-binding protein 68-like [Arctopsyche grandis]|uniref:general odorant-binding protein 68-like n=1 Tax=Arctopsyche grandis TaxID=121162 RepID=UPI00406D637E
MWTKILYVLINLLVIYAQNSHKCNFGPSRLRPDSCCMVLPAMVKVETLRECNIGDLYGENHPESPPCEPFNCLMTKYSYLGPNNKLNRLSIRSTIYNQYPPAWNAVIEASLNNCFAQLDGGSQCESRTFTFCFLHYMLLNCPQTQWVFSNSCDEARLFLQNCIPPSM